MIESALCCGNQGKGYISHEGVTWSEDSEESIGA